MVPATERSEIIADMIDVAREVGEIAKKKRKDPNALNISFKSADESVVSLVDTEGEELIKTKLLKKYGGSFVGEESGKTEGEAGNKKQWVVDPIDGTTNFLAGTSSPGNYTSDPNWGVSIALKEDGEKVTHAVVFFPATNEMFWAEAGKGAHVIDMDGDEMRLQLGEEVRRKTSIELAGGYLTPNADQIKTNLGNAYQELTKGGSRNTGSVVSGIIHVATGARGAYSQGNINEHDVAAASLIASEAGAQIFLEPVKDDEKGRSVVIVSHPQVHDALVDTYKKTMGVMDAKDMNLLQAPQSKVAIS